MIARTLLALTCLALLTGCAGQALAPGPDAAEARTARHFEAIRSDPVQLGMFLRRMPKGGDLHNHLSGAIYAESYIAWAAADGLCIDSRLYAFVASPCRDPTTRPAADALRDPVLYSAILAALSMRDFAPGSESGHDHFFATFGKFGAAETGHAGAMLAEVAHRAAAENVTYLELMWSPGMKEARGLGNKLGWSDDVVDFRRRLLAAGMPQIVVAARRMIDEAEAEMRSQLRCGTAEPDAGCAVTIRYLAQILRNTTPAALFAQTLLGDELAEADSRVLGLNLVAPEDDLITLHGYEQQMRIVGGLRTFYPRVGISLHAGELTLGLVPPEDLRFHIRGAVEIAGARRIGHGIDLAYERDPAGLLAEMAERRILVEINLTSNDVILGVRGAAHPLATYLRADVPVALSTDDAGVSRIDLSHEYERAAAEQGLDYSTLKRLARNSLEFSFLSGDSLWQGTRPYMIASACQGIALGAAPDAACRTLLERSPRAALQWRFETALAAFEAEEH